MELNETELGGVKECSVLIEGEGAWSRLKFESGVHRVQRVPETESGGRIHTSTCTVAVLPQVDEVEFQLNPADLRIDTFRASNYIHMLRKALEKAGLDYIPVLSLSFGLEKNPAV